jgi:hypothetical protein
MTFRTSHPARSRRIQQTEAIDSATALRYAQNDVPHESSCAKSQDPNTLKPSILRLRFATRRMTFRTSHPARSRRIQQTEAIDSATALRYAQNDIPRMELIIHHPPRPIDPPWDTLPTTPPAHHHSLFPSAPGNPTGDKDALPFLDWNCPTDADCAGNGAR